MEQQAKEAAQAGELGNFYKKQELPLAVKALRFYFRNLGSFAPNYSTKLFWKLFTQPNPRKIKDWHKEFLASAKNKSRFEVEGHEYCLFEWGEGNKTIILAHGWEGMTPDFKRLIEALLAQSDDYRIISIDFAAHGAAAGQQSNLPIFMLGLKELLRKEKEVYALIGHSLGACASFFAGLEEREEVHIQKLVMMGAYPIPYHFFLTFKEFMQVPDALFRKIFNNIQEQLDWDISQYNMYEQRYKLPVQEVLLVHDELDEVADFEKIRALAAGWEKVEVFYGRHGGHSRHFRHKEVVEVVSNFVGRSKNVLAD